MEAFQDKNVAEKYSKHALVYPQSISKTIMSFLSQSYGRSFDDEYVFDRMIDVGCGGGHSTVQFCKYFKSVIGSDVSEEQIKIAKELYSRENITYKAESAKEMSAEDNSVDLITSACAAHYFDMTRFQQECRRVLKPGGCVALYGFDYKDFEIELPTIPNLENRPSGMEIFQSSFYKPFCRFLRNTNLPSHDFFNHYQGMSQKITCLEKEWIHDLTFDKPFTLASFTAWTRSIPDKQLFIESLEWDPLDVFSNEVKKLWNVPGVADEDIHMNVTFKVFILMLRKDT